MDKKGEKDFVSVVFVTYDGVGVRGGMENTLFILWRAKPKPFTILFFTESLLTPASMGYSETIYIYMKISAYEAILRKMKSIKI